MGKQLVAAFHIFVEADAAIAVDVAAFEQLRAAMGYRLAHLVRRQGQITIGVGLVEEAHAGGIEIDRLSHSVRHAGKRIDLSAKEYSLLEYLAQNKGRVLSRTMIIEHVWDQSFEGLTNIVDVYIRQLRAKLEEHNAAQIIRTVRGVGYVIDEEAA